MQPSKQHEWAPPPAGTGSSRERICTKCGAKRSTTGDGECGGMHPDVVYEAASDYDPLT